MKMAGWNRWGRVKTFIAFFIICVLGIVSQTMAQEAPTDDPDWAKAQVFDLGVIEVVEDYEDIRNKTVDKISDDEMQLLDKDFLGDALNTLPGVALTHTGARNEMMW
jgi:hypothetical protein